MSPLRETLSSRELLSALSNSTKPAAVKMALLSPRADVGDVVYRFASAMLADTAAIPRSRKDLVLEGLSEVVLPSEVLSSGRWYEGNANVFVRSPDSDARTAKTGSRPWTYVSSLSSLFQYYSERTLVAHVPAWSHAARSHM